jgi:hypothetical protein
MRRHSEAERKKSDRKDLGKVRAKRAKQAKKGKVGAKPVLNKNIQNEVTKSVIIIITLHNYGKFRQFECIFFNNYERFGGLGV